MAEPTFPFQYQRPPGGGPQGMGTMLTWAQMMTKTTVNRLHPEVLRRWGALIHDAYKVGVPLGVGTGWRVQPDPPPAGFAQPGNSWHESTPVYPASATALAIDTVPNISWEWMHGKCGAYGLRHFKYVNNEPWHVQPSEISTSRKFATKLPPLTTWNLPSQPPPTTTPPPTTGGNVSVANLPTVKKGTQGGFARKVQSLLNAYEMNNGRPSALGEDGDFGSQSEAVLIMTQTRLGLTGDGICGPQTWTAILER